MSHPLQKPTYGSSHRVQKLEFVSTILTSVFSYTRVNFFSLNFVVSLTMNKGISPKGYP